MFGDVSSVKLTIVEGGIFEGRSSMSKEEIKVIEFQAKSHVTMAQNESAV